MLFFSSLPNPQDESTLCIKDQQIWQTSLVWNFQLWWKHLLLIAVKLYQTDFNISIPCAFLLLSPQSTGWINILYQRPTKFSKPHWFETSNCDENIFFLSLNAILFSLKNLSTACMLQGIQRSLNSTVNAALLEQKLQSEVGLPLHFLDRCIRYISNPTYISTNKIFETIKNDGILIYMNSMTSPAQLPFSHFWNWSLAKPPLLYWRTMLSIS